MIKREWSGTYYLVALVPVLLLMHAATAAASSAARIPAKAAVIMDAEGNILYSKFPDAHLAAASTVKLVTAMVVLDHLDPAQKVKISKNAAAVRSIQPRIQAGEEMTVSDLLHLALMKSVNSAAVALAEATSGSERDFAVLMNRKARDIGALNTLFANASGLPRGGTQYSTVRDLALIMKTALGYPMIKEILSKKVWLINTVAGRTIFVDNSNDLLWQNDNIIGKTGFTGNARHCFVCAVNTDKGPLYTVVLGARSRSSLWKSTLMLAQYGVTAEAAVDAQRAVQPVSRTSN